MSEKNLPTTSSNESQEPSQAPSRGLTIAAAGSLVGGVAALVLFQSPLFAGLLLLCSFILFLGRGLVRRSIALTATQNSPALLTNSERLEDIRKQVSKCKFLENIEAEGTEAAQQAQVLSQQYKDLIFLLGQKFEPGELTYDRYQQSIDDTCLALGENLLYLKNRLESLNLTKSTDSEWSGRRDEVRASLASTKTALSELTTLFQSLNQITTKETHRDQLESSLNQIRDLAERAKNYSKH